MKLKDLFERVDTTPRIPRTRYVEKMYFGCCKGDAQSLDRSGFSPSVIGRKEITLVSTPEMAKDMAGFRQCDAIVEVTKIPADHVQVDFKADNHPSDIWEAIERINAGEDVILKLRKRLSGNNFEYLNKLRRK
jgi:hypothetical protein